MKVVINSCFGGFSLSHEATMRLAEMKGVTLYPFVDKRDEAGGIDFNSRKVEPYTGQDDAFVIHYCTKPLPGNGTYDEDSYYSGDRPDERSDPDLVKIVEEMGGAANGAHAELQIVEIPDDVDYEISEYDGIEHIAEKHRTWE